MTMVKFGLAMVKHGVGTAGSWWAIAGCGSAIAKLGPTMVKPDRGIVESCCAMVAARRAIGDRIEAVGEA